MRSKDVRKAAAAGAGALVLAAIFLWGCTGDPDAAGITMFKTPGCGCCERWAEHLRSSGFPVEVVAAPDLRAIKARYGIHRELGSCHTAIVDGYVVEGHVPADLIRRLLRERPDVAGLTVPGMPAGSPGMEMENGYTQPYEVLTFDARGNTEVFARR